MSSEVRIPTVGESVSSGTVAQWHVQNGDFVQAGQQLLSLETDKITQELEAEVSGVIELLVAEGDEVEVGAIVATIEEGEQGEQGGGDQEVGETTQEAPAANASEGAKAGAEAGIQATAEPVDIVIPTVGESVSSGTLSAWLVADGGQVSAGQQILSLETDKITQELEAEQSGILQHLVEEGQEVEIGQVVAKLTPSSSKQAASDSSSAPAQVSQSLQQAAADISQMSKPASAASSKDLPPPKKEEAKQEKATLTPAPAPIPTGDKPVTRKKMTQLRRKIAQHLVNAQHEAAILTTFNEVDMSAVMGLRKELQESFVARHGVKLGFMSFFIKAVTEALQAVPSINARIEGDEIVQQHYYDIGCAIGTPKGLVVPVLRDCDQKDFAQIEKDILAYAERAKEGKLELSDLQGGVFTVSNGGVYGSLLSTPILNPPQSGILGMHTIQQRPVAVNGEVAIRPMMYLALSYDHRLVDGKEAVSFLIRIKDCIEQPTRLLVGA